MAKIVRANLNNPELLRWARESAGYELDDIAKACGTTVEKAEAWESGDKSPTYKQLKKFANKVKRPVAALYLPTVPKSAPLPDDFRTLPGHEPGVFGPQALLAFRELRNNLSALRDILTEMNEPLEFSLPRWKMNWREIRQRAAQLREFLGISFEAQMEWRDAHQALNEWRDVLFDHGVIAQVFQMPIEEVRGFSLETNGLGGVGLNSKELGYGRVFSLFHEVVHLCIGKPGVSGEADIGVSYPKEAKIERYCDALAAAFLLPADQPQVRSGLEQLGHEFTLEAARDLAKKFKVSKYVIAHRLHDEGGIESSVYSQERKRWIEEDKAGRKGGGGGDHVLIRVSHLGRRYVQKVMEAVHGDVLTTYGASQMLTLHSRHLNRAYERAM